MLDTLLKNGTVIDGSGRKAMKADVGIFGGKISVVGNLDDAEAAKTIDVSGLVVSPGFIDMHSHSDLSLPAHRRGEGSLSQGITTELIGSCGWSMAPVKEETKISVLRWLISGLVDKESYESLDWSWHSFGQFLDYLSKGGIGVNVAPQVGQSLIRAHVVGTEKREVAPGETAAMKALVRQAMEDGAWGLSTGRSYKPGGFAPESEIVELVKVVAEYDGIYTTHMKNEGEEIFDAVDEVISIAEKTGVKAEISHHKAIGRKNFGKVGKTLEMIANARRKGHRITCDTYPYEFSQASSLARMLPDALWKELKGKDAALPTNEELWAALSDKETMVKLKSLPSLLEAAPRLANYTVVKCPSHPSYSGRIVEDLAKESGKGPLDVIADLISEDGMGVWAAWPISIDDVHSVISADFAMGGTDAFNLDKEIETAVHPRHYGTFPRIVGRFVTKDHLYSLEEAVKKVTHNPAQVIGFKDRGLVEAGYWADLVVFDAAKLMDEATGSEPYRRASGIEYVLVNGKVALEKGTVKPVFAGEVLRK